MLPNFLIIGAQKSGSTFFLKCLGEHPDVFMPPGEIRFFEDPEYLNSTIDQLEALFQHVSHQTALGIKRPGYLSRPECAARIHHHIPQAKLIAILRNPVERAISAYYHLMKCGFIPVKSVEEGLGQIVSGEYQKTYPKAAEIIDFGFYYRHLTRYLEYFAPDQMLILPFDAIKANAVDAIKQTYRFIGVDDNYIPKRLQGPGRPNPNPGVYSLTRLRVLNLRNPFLYTYNQDKTRRYSKPRRTLVAKIADKLITSTDSMVLTRLVGNEKPEISPELTYRLFKIYEDDINHLETFLSQELTGWKMASPNGKHS